MAIAISHVTTHARSMCAIGAPFSTKFDILTMLKDNPEQLKVRINWRITCKIEIDLSYVVARCIICIQEKNTLLVLQKLLYLARLRRYTAKEGALKIL